MSQGASRIGSGRGNGKDHAERECAERARGLPRPKLCAACARLAPQARAMLQLCASALSVNLQALRRHAHPDELATRTARRGGRRARVGCGSACRRGSEAPAGAPLTTPLLSSAATGCARGGSTAGGHACCRRRSARTRCRSSTPACCAAASAGVRLTTLWNSTRPAHSPSSTFTTSSCMRGPIWRAPAWVRVY